MAQTTTINRTTTTTTTTRATTTSTFTTSTQTKSSTNVFSLGKNFGKVQSCSLKKAKLISVEKKKYCAVDQGDTKTQSEAIAHCKTLNARLPLPKSNKESAAFLKAFPSTTWIDITDPGWGLM